MVSLKNFGKWRRDTLWTTADNRRVKICDMTDQHVINVIWHIHENLRQYGNDMLQNFIHEANFRGLEWTMRTPYKYPAKKYQVNVCNICGKTPSWCDCTWYR